MTFYIIIIYFLLLTNIQSLTEIASSYIDILPLRTSFQPANPIELISNYTTSSLFDCTSACNINPQCRTYVYDFTSKQCTLFEGEMSTGTVIVSNSSTTKVGSIEYFADLYQCYNRTDGQCQFNRYLVADSSTKLGICPTHTYWNGTMCLNQRYLGSSCTFTQSCRSDMNLICNNITCGGGYEINLVKNGDGETGPCSPDVTLVPPTSWYSPGSITQTLYNDTHATMMTTDPGPSDRGNCYFWGSQDAYAYMSQTISVDVYSTDIDLNKVSFNFSVWTGGWQYQDDAAQHWVSFYDSNNIILGNTSIAPVFAVDRMSVTALLYREATGMIPINTRSLTVVIAMVAASVSDDAAVDDISFKLHYIP